MPSVDNQADDFDENGQMEMPLGDFQKSALHLQAVPEEDAVDDAPLPPPPPSGLHLHSISEDDVVDDAPLPPPPPRYKNVVARNTDAFEEVVVQPSRTRGSVISMIGGVGGNVLPRLIDHYSLEMPSSQVRFRHARIRVYEQANSQIVLEEKTNRDENGRVRGTEVSVKQITDATAGLRILRFVYGLVATFTGGFLFIFSVMILLYLFIELSSRLGLGDRTATIVGFIAVLLSVPVYVYGLSAAMAMVGSYVKDTWQGHVFLRTFGNWNIVFTEWVSFLVYLGIPFVTMIITLFAGIPEWWYISLITWFIAILIFFGIFAIFLLFYDVSGCLYLIEEVADPYFGSIESGKWRYLSLVRKAILLRQVERFSGTKRLSYTLSGKLDSIEDDFTQGQEAASEYMGLYSRVTRANCCAKVFQPLDPPQRQYSLEEVLGVSPFLTAHSWSLEKIYCRNRRKSRQVTVINGPAALSRQQVKSSFVCAILGALIAILLPISMMVWYGQAAVLVILVAVFIFLCCTPTFRGNYRMYKSYKKLMQQAESRAGKGGPERAGRKRSVASEAIYQVWERHRINRPSPAFCYTMFFLEVFFLYLWPLVFLFGSGNWRQGILFIFIGLFALVRHFLSAPAVLKELGTFAALGKEHDFGANAKHREFIDTETDREWKAKSRLSAIVSNVSRGRARAAFTWIFAVIVCLFLGVFLASVRHGTDTDPTEASKDYRLPSGFYYDEQPNLPYQTCQMGKGLQIPGAQKTALEDYAFVAAISYAGDNTTQRLLDDYFGPGEVTDNPNVVKQFKEFNNYVNSNAYYKYFTIAANPDFALVSVRGTSNPWDMLTDAQLWGSAALFQVLRAALPFGEVFTPILHEVVQFVSFLESSAIRKVSYYKEISAFVEYLRETGLAQDVHITGHSLGGGLALISGAQTKATAVGLSAVNSMLSRGTFDPPISEYDLNTYTFNIVPNRDIVPRIDDVADMFQRIECRSDPNDTLGCHAASRSFCEIMWMCGSFGRPAMCICTRKYKYPDPLPPPGGANRTWAEICEDVEY